MKNLFKNAAVSCLGLLGLVAPFAAQKAAAQGNIGVSYQEPDTFSPSHGYALSGDASGKVFVFCDKGKPSRMDFQKGASMATMIPDGGKAVIFVTSGSGGPVFGGKKMCGGLNEMTAPKEALSQPELCKARDTGLLTGQDKDAVLRALNPFLRALFP